MHLFNWSHTMTLFTLKTAALGLVAGTALFATPAMAVPVISCSVTACTFGNADPTTTAAPFFDTFIFTVPYARSFLGTVYSNSTNFPVDNVNFVFNGVRLDGHPFAAINVGNPEIRTISAIIAAGTHTITVRGSSGRTGFYTGSAVLGGVPEPMTWALMILGFGVVGAGMRRRSVSSMRVTYA
jgi:hypothetical protein